MAMTLIGTTTVGSGGATSVTFSSIPGTFTDLFLVASSRINANGGDYLIVQLNGTTTGYTSKHLWSNGSTTATYTNPDSTSTGMWLSYPQGTESTANTFTSANMYLPDYTSTTKKSAGCESVPETNAATTVVQTTMTSCVSTVTAAVTSLVIKSFYSGSIVQNSVFSLYGITKGSGGATVS